MKRPTVRLATSEDLRSFAGRDPPEWCIEWVSYVLERDGDLLALGSVVWDCWGRTWGNFDCRVPISRFLMHRMAVKVIGDLRAIGVKSLHAYADENTEGAEKWLRRLGFKPGLVLPPDPRRVWVCAL